METGMLQPSAPKLPRSNRSFPLPAGGPLPPAYDISDEERQRPLEQIDTRMGECVFCGQMIHTTDRAHSFEIFFCGDGHAYHKQCAWTSFCPKCCCQNPLCREVDHVLGPRQQVQLLACGHKYHSNGLCNLTLDAKCACGAAVTRVATGDRSVSERQQSLVLLPEVCTTERQMKGAYLTLLSEIPRLDMTNTQMATALLIRIEDVFQSWPREKSELRQALFNRLSLPVLGSVPVVKYIAAYRIPWEEVSSRMPWSELSKFFQRNYLPVLDDYFLQEEGFSLVAAMKTTPPKVLNFLLRESNIPKEYFGKMGATLDYFLSGGVSPRDLLPLLEMYDGPDALPGLRFQNMDLVRLNGNIPQKWKAHMSATPATPIPPASAVPPTPFSSPQRQQVPMPSQPATLRIELTPDIMKMFG